MQEIIPVNLKEWLSWKNDKAYEGKIDYIRVYTIPDKDEILFLRHIEEHKKIQNGTTQKIEYSIITKIPGRFNVSSCYDPNNYTHAKNLMSDYQVFNFHSGESYTIESFLTLFLMKKSDKITIDYYQKNDSEFIKKLGYHQESLYFKFSVKNKVFEVEISHIPNSELTMYLHYNSTGYKVKEMIEEIYPEKQSISSCIVNQGQKQSEVIIA